MAAVMGAARSPRMESDASLSLCGRYRHWLTRRWGVGSCMGFVMLNPSTADADREDATIRRCIGFARREGCGAIIVGNLFQGKPRCKLSADAADSRIVCRHSGFKQRDYVRPVNFHNDQRNPISLLCQPIPLKCKLSCGG